MAGEFHGDLRYFIQMFEIDRICHKYANITLSSSSFHISHTSVDVFLDEPQLASFASLAMEEQHRFLCDEFPSCKTTLKEMNGNTKLSPFHNNLPVSFPNFSSLPEAPF